MAQLSTNTIFYDQLIKRIQAFLSKYMNNEVSSYEEMAVELEELITQANKYSLNPISKYEQVIKGEPPSSSKMNRFINNAADDLNIIAKQLDYQSAQLVSLYNLFNSEIEKENQFANRIKSKMKIMQAYSQSPAEDLYYFGDSFDNMDFVDVQKTPRDMMAVIRDGSAVLPSSSTSTWSARSISVVEELSNGFIGNNHQVYAKDNVDSTYRYAFEDNSSVGLLQNIIDNNPLTFFEYEGIYIDPADKRRNNAKEFEFTYSKVSSTDGVRTKTYQNWSEKKLNEPLKLCLRLKSDRARRANSMSLAPYFGSLNNVYSQVKITRITAVSEPDKKIIELINEPIFIGSSFVPQSVESVKNYFYDKAKIYFTEVLTSEIDVYLEQGTYSDVKIQHCYWKPFNNTGNLTSLNEDGRFDPSSLTSLGFQNVQYDQSDLVPDILRPNLYKSQLSLSSKKISVSYRDSLRSQKYVVSFKRLETGSSSSLKKFYYTNFPVGFQNPAEQQNKAATGDITLAFEYDSQASAENSKSYIQSKISSGEWSSSLFQDINVETIQVNLQPKTLSASISLKKGFELYNAKRFGIALRSIDVFYDNYVQKAEIISKPFTFGFDVKTLTISAETEFDVSGSNSNQSYIKYYISVDDGKNWIKISPIENPFIGIDEILSFNESVEPFAQIKGVTYKNYPEIPKETKNIRVKIELEKPKYQNISPVIHSYQIAGRVQQS